MKVKCGVSDCRNNVKGEYCELDEIHIIYNDGDPACKEYDEITDDRDEYSKKDL